MTLASNERRRRRFTADEVIRMVEVGVLAQDEPFELIDGELVVMSPQGRLHRNLATSLRRRLEAVYQGRAHGDSRSPIRTGEHHLPEPDVVLIRGDVDEYWDHIPRGDETLLVVEIAQTSRRADAGKARLYAAGRVPVYWLVDLPSRTVTVHETPQDDEYRGVRTLHEGETVALPETDQVWPVGDLLPPPDASARE